MLTREIGVYDIAKKVGVTPQTIYREIRKGLTGERDPNGRLIYNPAHAENAAQQNRKNSARKTRRIIGLSEDNS
jgi:IS30 family transposase